MPYAKRNIVPPILQLATTAMYPLDYNKGYIHGISDVVNQLDVYNIYATVWSGFKFRTDLFFTLNDVNYSLNKT